MSETCQSCGSELFYRDNDNPLLNCVAQCENMACKSPYREEYYEEPAEMAAVRNTDAWYECWIDVYVMEDSDISKTVCDNTKRADAEYTKRYAKEFPQ